MKNKIILLVVFMFLITGCSFNESEEENVISNVDSSDYSLVYPFNASDARIAHYNFSPSSLQIQEVGVGLLNISKNYFSVDTFYVAEGQMLTYDDLVVNTSMEDQQGLLGRTSSTNPVGLNPKKNSHILLENGETVEVENPVLILDIYEVDMMVSKKGKYELGGISIAIVVSDQINVKDGLYGSTYSMDADKFKIYYEESARKVVSYLRNKGDVGEDIPILVSVYNSNSEDKALPGNFISSALFKGRNATFESISEEWVIFPSKEAMAIDNETYNKFTEIKNSLESTLPENVAVLGKGLYVGDDLSKLHMTITIQGKTYNEVNSTILYTKKLMEKFTDTDVTYTAEVKIVNETVALLEKNPDSKDIIVISKY